MRFISSTLRGLPRKHFNRPFTVEDIMKVNTSSEGSTVDIITEMIMGETGRLDLITPISSGVFICKSLVNDLRHGNYIY